MNCRVAYPNLARLASHTAVTNINVVIAGGQVNTGRLSHGNVAAAGRIVNERLRTGARVTATCGRAFESLVTQGRVVDSGGDALECVLSQLRVALGYCLCSRQEREPGEREGDVNKIRDCFHVETIGLNYSLRVNPSQYLPAGRMSGGGLALLADLPQGGIVPFRAGRRQAFFDVPTDQFPRADSSSRNATLSAWKLGGHNSPHHFAARWI